MRRIALGILLAALGLSVSTTPGAGTSATLQDPGTGESVVVEPGAEALHLVFFATWCQTCVDELTRLGELEARWGGQGYQLVIVALRERQSADRLAVFVKEKHPPGRTLFDAKGEAQRVWEPERLPTHVVIDASGREVARARGLAGDIEEALAELLAKQRGGERRR
jgi:hypothetical protein